ncbi:hypothetical protein Tco_0920117 [Tanacetum coccineum]
MDSYQAVNHVQKLRRKSALAPSRGSIHQRGASAAVNLQNGILIAKLLEGKEEDTTTVDPKKSGKLPKLQTERPKTPLTGKEEPLIVRGDESPITFETIVQEPCN